METEVPREASAKAVNPLKNGMVGLLQEVMIFPVSRVRSAPFISIPVKHASCTSSGGGSALAFVLGGFPAVHNYLSILASCPEEFTPQTWPAVGSNGLNRSNRQSPERDDDP